MKINSKQEVSCVSPYNYLEAYAELFDFSHLIVNSLRVLHYVQNIIFLNSKVISLKHYLFNKIFMACNDHEFLRWGPV